MAPLTFCKTILTELKRESADEHWVRGAAALCLMCARTDAQRFELIVSGFARGDDGSALADGARWLLARLQAARFSPTR